MTIQYKMVCQANSVLSKGFKNLFNLTQACAVKVIAAFN